MLFIFLGIVSQRLVHSSSVEDLQNLKPPLISIKGKIGWNLLPGCLSQRSEEEAARPWEGRREG